MTIRSAMPIIQSKLIHSDNVYTHYQQQQKKDLENCFNKRTNLYIIQDSPRVRLCIEADSFSTKNNVLRTYIAHRTRCVMERRTQFHECFLDLSRTDDEKVLYSYNLQLMKIYTKNIYSFGICCTHIELFY